MSSADQNNFLGAPWYWLQRWPQRYGFALAAVGVATLLKYGVDAGFGFSPPFLFYYPTITIIALFAVDALVAAGVMPGKRTVFLWTSDEEIGSGSSQMLIEREARRSDAVMVSGLRGA